MTASIFDFVNELNEFSYELSVLDRVWTVLFPHQGKNWHHLNVSRYKNTFYITHVRGNGGSLEVEPETGVRAMEHLRTAAYSVENHGQLAKRRITPFIKWESLPILKPTDC